MANKNGLVIILTSLAIVALFSLAGAIVWLGSRLSSGGGAPASSSASPATSPLASATVAPASSPVSPPDSLEQVPLESDRKVDYSKLRDLLRQKNWKSADQETYLRLLDAAGPRSQASGMTAPGEIDTLSCKDLKTVDQLWNTASNGQQGFTVQMNTLRGLGSDYRRMYDKLGWQTLPPANKWLFQVDYNPQTRRREFKPGQEPNYQSPPPGHLPTVEIGYNVDVAFSGALRRCRF